MKKSLLILTVIALFAVSCSKPEEETGPKLIFKFRFDSTQTRLDNFGNVASMKSGNWGQSPVFQSMSAHYIELASDSITPLGFGSILYRAAEVGADPNNAIDFSKSVFAGNNEAFYSVPLKNIAAGTYKWLRVSLAYQNYDIKVLYKNDALPAPYNSMLLDGRVASFVGFNTYITSYKVKDQTIAVNGNKKQGYGAVELFNLPVGVPSQTAIQWQAPVSTTATSGLTITGNETQDIVVTVSLSTNKSFEWKDKNGDHLYQPLNAANNSIVEDSVVDMGLRGLVPIIN